MLQHIFIIAVFVMFVHATTWEGQINNWVQRVTFHWPEFTKKPLFDCPICMAPWWGTALIITGVLGSFTIIETIVATFAAGGVNAVLVYAIAIGKYYAERASEDDDNEQQHEAESD